MNILPDIEFQKLKNLATKPGPKRYLAFAELAIRTRDKPSIWDLQKEGPFWGPRDPNEMEWAFLEWSETLNEEKNPEFQQKLDPRLHELETFVDLTEGAPAIEFFHAIGDELSKEDAKNKERDPNA